MPFPINVEILRSRMRRDIIYAAVWMFCILKGVWSTGGSSLKNREWRSSVSVIWSGHVKSASLCKVFSPLSALPFLYTSLVVILKEQMNTHENKMSSTGLPSWLVLLLPPEATFDICSKGEDLGLSKYEIWSLRDIDLGLLWERHRQRRQSVLFQVPRRVDERNHLTDMAKNVTTIIFFPDWSLSIFITTYHNMKQ